MDGSVLQEKSSFKMLGLTFSSKLKIEENWSLESFYEDFFSRLLYISLNLPCSHAWNTVVMSGLALLDATWNC